MKQGMKRMTMDSRKQVVAMMLGIGMLAMLVMLGEGYAGPTAPPSRPVPPQTAPTPVHVARPAAPSVAPAKPSAATPKVAEPTVVPAQPAPSTQPTSRPSTQPTLQPEEKLVKDFWTAVIASDYQELFRLVGFPFVSDSKCQVFGEFKALEDFLKQQKIPAQVQIGIPQLVSLEGKVSPEIAKSLAHLSPATADCDDDDTNQLILGATKFPKKFVQITLTVGDQKVPTLVRVSEIEGRWVVTGLDN